MKYSIIPFDLKGSFKPFDHHGRIQEIDLPEDAVPIGFDIIIRDVTTKGELCDWGFYPTVKVSESWQRKWLDDAHTEFVCVIDGKLKHYSVITRVYCMTPKAAAGVPVPEVPVKRRSSGVQEIEDIMQALNAVVDSKDHSEVLRLIEAAKEKLVSFNRSMTSKTGVPCPEVQEIKQDLDAIVYHSLSMVGCIFGTKDRSEVLRLIEAVKEKLGSFDRIRCPVCDGRGTLPYGFYHDQPRDATGGAV